jgi:hypothetical protein
MFLGLLCLQSVTAQDSSKTQLLHQSGFDTSSKIKVDSPKVSAPVAKDSLVKKKVHSPQKATRLSAILPGAGQIYNHQYWKAPIVWLAIGIPTGLYVYNHTYYKRTAYAYDAVYAATYPGADGNVDSSMLAGIHPSVKDKNGNILSLNDYQYFRNQFRRNQDLCILWVVIMWGLNIADASVSGHLKHFDVSDDISMRIEPQFNPTFRAPGIGFVFNFKTPQRKMIALNN